MKTKFLMAAFLCAAVCLTSCDGSDSKLAGELVGTWKGSTTEMTKGKKDKPDKEGRKESDKSDKRKGNERGSSNHSDGGEMT